MTEPASPRNSTRQRTLMLALIFAPVLLVFIGLGTVLLYIGFRSGETEFMTDLIHEAQNRRFEVTGDWVAELPRCPEGPAGTPAAWGEDCRARWGALGIAPRRSLRCRYWIEPVEGDTPNPGTPPTTTMGAHLYTACFEGERRLIGNDFQYFRF